MPLLKIGSAQQKMLFWHQSCIRRAGDFLQLQHEIVVGRIKGTLLKKQKQPSNNEDGEEIDGPDSFPLSQEEKWQKRPTRKRKSKYFNSPPPPKKRLVESTTSASQKHPKTKSHIKGAAVHPPPQKIQGCCPYWGGEGWTVSMTNTCTVDNLLYMLHMTVKRRPGIKIDLNTCSNNWISTLLQVHKLFEKTEWSQGKLLWLNFMGCLWDRGRHGCISS